MTKRHWFALFYLVAGLLYGCGIAFVVQRLDATVGASFAQKILSGLGVLGLAVLTFPVGAIPLVLFLLALAREIADFGTLLYVMTPMAMAAGYWQWFRLYPRLFRGSAVSRKTGYVRRYWRQVLFCALVFAVGWSDFLLNRLLFASGLVIAIDQPILISSCLFGLYLLTFPCGIVGLIVSVALTLSGYFMSLEMLAVATPFCALFGGLQWFWLLPKLYRRKELEASVVEVF